MKSEESFKKRFGLALVHRGKEKSWSRKRSLLLGLVSKNRKSLGWGGNDWGGEEMGGEE